MDSISVGTMDGAYPNGGPLTVRGGEGPLESAGPDARVGATDIEVVLAPIAADRDLDATHAGEPITGDIAPHLGESAIVLEREVPGELQHAGPAAGDTPRPSCPR
jgi:hypothetical protein